MVSQSTIKSIQFATRVKSVLGHAVIGGLRAVHNGGKFITGGIGKLATLGTNHFIDTNNINNRVFQGLVIATTGGAVAALAGGSFELGFVTAGLAFATNEVASSGTILSRAKSWWQEKLSGVRFYTGGEFGGHISKINGTKSRGTYVDLGSGDIGKYQSTSYGAIASSRNFDFSGEFEWGLDWSDASKPVQMTNLSLTFVKLRIELTVTGQTHLNPQNMSFHNKFTGFEIGFGLGEQKFDANLQVEKESTNLESYFN